MTFIPQAKYSKEPNKGKVVSNSEFETIQKEKAEEMRERYQGGRRVRIAR